MANEDLGAPASATIVSLLGDIDRADALPEWVSDAWLEWAWAQETNPHALAGLLGVATHPGFLATRDHWNGGANGADKIRDAVGRAVTRAELVAGVDVQRAKRAARMTEATATWPARRAELYERRRALREPRLSEEDLHAIRSFAITSEVSRG